MSRQRRKHPASVARSKWRRYVRRMTGRWRHDTGRFHDKPTAADLREWVVSKLMGAGARALAQDSLMPRLTYRADSHTSDL